MAARKATSKKQSDANSRSVRQPNTHVFVLKSVSGLTGAEMAAAFKAAYPHMGRLIASHTPPFLARVTAAGNVAEIEGYKQILRRIK